MYWSILNANVPRILSSRSPIVRGRVTGQDGTVSLLHLLAHPLPDSKSDWPQRTRSDGYPICTTKSTQTLPHSDDTSAVKIVQSKLYRYLMPPRKSRATQTLPVSQYHGKLRLHNSAPYITNCRITRT